VDAHDDAARLTAFYGALSSLDRIMAALDAAGVARDQVRARDLYGRDLDLHNLGALRVLEALATAADEHRALSAGATVLDVGCGLGGPGRFLADRSGCSVVGIDLLALRIDIARALTDLTGMVDRVGYRVADATDLPFPGRSVDEAWVIDVALHVRDKRALFGEIARVVRPGGLLVLHDQMAPIPDVMAPLTSQAPYLAVELAELVQLVDGAGLRVLSWRDTTELVLVHFGALRARLGQPAGRPSEDGTSTGDTAAAAVAQAARAMIDAYVAALTDHGSTTGFLIARRR